MDLQKYHFLRQRRITLFVCDVVIVHMRQGLFFPYVVQFVVIVHLNFLTPIRGTEKTLVDRSKQPRFVQDHENVCAYEQQFTWACFCIRVHTSSFYVDLLMNILACVCMCVCIFKCSFTLTRRARVYVCVCRMRLIGLLFVFRVGVSSWCGWPCISRSDVRILPGVTLPDVRPERSLVSADAVDVSDRDATSRPVRVEVPRIVRPARPRSDAIDFTHIASAPVEFVGYVSSRSEVSFAPPPVPDDPIQTRHNTSPIDIPGELPQVPVRTEVSNDDVWENMSELGYESQSVSSLDSDDPEGHYRRAYRRFLGNYMETPDDSFLVDIDQLHEDT